jgi:lysozyme
MNDLIKEFEGCYLKAYKCPAGVLTIGYGTTIYPDGSKVKEGDEITEEQAEACLNDYCSKIKLPKGLSLKQRTALQSLIYNIGQRAFDRSSLKTAIVKKDIKAIYKNWDWISAGGKPMRGLARRRARELALFFEDEL